MPYNADHKAATKEAAVDRVAVKACYSSTEAFRHVCHQRGQAKGIRSTDPRIFKAQKPQVPQLPGAAGIQYLKPYGQKQKHRRQGVAYQSFVGLA